MTPFQIDAVKTLKETPWALMYHERLQPALLVQYPHHQWEVWAICAALEEGVFFDLADAPNTPLSVSTAAQLVSMLVQRIGIAPRLGRSTIETISQAFDRPIDGSWPDIELPRPTPYDPTAGLAASEVPLGDGYAMTQIEPGAFVMAENGASTPQGSLAAKRHIMPFAQPHHVTLSQPFAMGITPVTNGHWQAIMGQVCAQAAFKGSDHPVNGIDWLQAIHFCNAASRKSGLPEVYRVQGQSVAWADPSLDGYRLPTEAEWEYVCRAGTSTPFHTDAVLSADMANFDGQFQDPPGPFRACTTPVASFAPNPWGLYDMHGNVHEWCWDYAAPLVTDATNPQGPDSGAYRIVRGGGWTVWRANHCASGFRLAFRPDMGGFDCGFRMVRSMPTR